MHNYCRHCGARLPAETAFCPGCGANISVQAAVYRPGSSFTCIAPRKLPKNWMMNFLVIPVAIILLLMSIGYMALSVVGREGTAQVIGYEQMYIINDDDSTREHVATSWTTSFSQTANIILVREHGYLKVPAICGRPSRCAICPFGRI